LFHDLLFEDTLQGTFHFLSLFTLYTECFLHLSVSMQGIMSLNCLFFESKHIHRSIKSAHMKIQFLTFVLSIFTILSSAFSQNETCGTDHLLESMKNSDYESFMQSEEVHSQRVIKFRNDNPNFSLPYGGNNSLLGGPSCPRPKYILPVVVHVIYHSSVPNTKVDSNQIFDQIEKTQRSLC
jgi:hypothetical protein